MYMQCNTTVVQNEDTYMSFEKSKDYLSFGKNGTLGVALILNLLVTIFDICW